MSASTILCPGCRAALIPAVDWPEWFDSIFIETCVDCQHTGLTAVGLFNREGLRELATEARYFRHPDGFVEFPV